MAELVQDLECRLTRPDFSDLQFTRSSVYTKWSTDSISAEHLSWLEAVRFAEQQDSMLVSAREVAALRMKGVSSHARLDQCTRTAVIYFREKDHDPLRAAIDDTPDPQANLVHALGRAHGTCGRTGYGPSPMERQHSLIVRAMERAERTNRVLEVPLLGSRHIPLSTCAAMGRSPFGQHPWIQAILGANLAEPYAAFLNTLDYPLGYLGPIDFYNFSLLHVDPSRVEVRFVRLFADDAGNWPNKIIVDGRFDSLGHARGVRNAREYMP